MVLLLCAVVQAQPPQAEISNGLVRAKLYLPDPEKGYYRGTRFDWSGVIASLEFKGHNFFGQWFEKYDPKLHDAITGPVEEFLSGDSSLGYEGASPGESFVRIGVGSVKKSDRSPYQRFHTYDIADSGKWSIRRGPDWIEFSHELSDTAGYSYVYRKTVRLTAGKPELALEHSLRNTGRKRIQTSVYNHDFFMLDGLPTSPDVVVRFPFEPRAKSSFGALAAIRGRELVYLKELEGRETVFSELEGFGTTASDFDFRIENRRTGVGVRQTGDRPISKVVFWSPRTTVCPEAYIDLNVEPGQETHWRISYEFYELR
jgi:hypothetical protein